MRVSLFQEVEILSIFKEIKGILADIKINGLQITHHDVLNFENEVLSDQNNQKLTICILTPQQFNLNLKQISNYFNKIQQPKTIGFFLVEDPNNLPTIRLRKKISLLSKKKVFISTIQYPYTKAQIILEIQNSIQSLFYSISYEHLFSFTQLRETESKAINDISKAMTDRSFLGDEFLNLVLNKSVEISQADAGFAIIRKDALIQEDEQPIDSSSNVTSIRKTRIFVIQEFIEKHRILNSQKIKLKKDIFSYKKSKITQFMINDLKGISAFEEMENSKNQDDSYPTLNDLITYLDYNHNLYKIKSFCALPIRRPSGGIDGFIILINKKKSAERFLNTIDDVDNLVTEFSSHDLNLLESIANHAGIVFENAKLISNLRKAFESFTAASITAIESRDPTTRGHSERVAILTVGLAQAVNNTTSGHYKSLEFNKDQLEEIRYASLLHDFGKIGVREHILQKEKKLFTYELDKIHTRFSHLRDKLYINILESYIESLMLKKAIPTQEDYNSCRKEISKVSQDLENYWNIIREVNEPTVLNLDIYEKIAEISATRIVIGEQAIPILTPNEIRILSIKKGSLSLEERLEIETHVTHSYNFLVQIPWSTNLKDIPDIVYGHHERLDGSGYPRKLKDKEIPAQAKMMAITDIFDALVAQDRPYKKAISYEKALDILHSDVKNGKLDAEFFKIFVEAKVGELTLNYKLESLKTA